MRFVKLQQGTAAWFDWRRQGLGGSDAPCVMGCGFATADELLAEKVGGVRREETFAMRRGRRLEPAARRLLEERTGVVFRPACVEHDQEPWLRASLDGIDFLGECVAELKAPDVVDHEIALGGVVPRHYWPQVQHVLLVTDAEVCFYASYSEANRFGGEGSPDRLAVVEVEADAEFQGSYIEAATAFWRRVQEARGVRRAAV